MAIGAPYTIVNSGETVSTATTTYQVTVTGSTSAGDCIVVAVLNSNTTVSGVTDSQGNTYALAASNTATSLKSYVFTSQGTPNALTSGTDWIKATFATTGSTTTRITIFARGCSGIAASGAVDSSGTANADNNSGSTSPAITGTSVLSMTSEWIVAALFTASTGGTPAGWSDSFTSAGTNSVAGEAILTVADEVVSANTAQNAAATITSAKWAIVQVALTASQLSGSATAALTLAATATGSRRQPGSVTAAVSLSAAAAAQRQQAKAGSAALTLAASATGSSKRTGSPAAALTLGASAAGSRQQVKAATAAVLLAATATGIVPVIAPTPAASSPTLTPATESTASVTPATAATAAVSQKATSSASVTHA